MSNVHAIREQVAGQVVEFEPWRTIDQLCEYLQCGDSWVYEQIKLGLPCRKHGRSLRFRFSAVDAWLDAQQG